MRVTLVSNTLDKAGGLERYVSELAGALARRDVDVCVVSKGLGAELPADEVRADGVRLIRTPAPSKSDPAFALRYPYEIAAGVLRALRQIGPGTILHGHFAPPMLPLAVRGAPYLYTFHAPVYRELLSERQDSYALPGPVQGLAVAGLREAERLVVRRAARSLVLSEFMRAELGELHTRTAAGALLLPGGIDTEWFSPGETPRPEWAAAAGPLLFTARRLAPRTGVFELVQAMPAILARLPGAMLAIAGAGAQEQRIREEIERLGLGERVHMLGRISEEDLRAWYRRADLFVMPTQQLEGFGLSTAEALACGTPVVGTPAGATPELLAPLDPRLVTRDASPQAIADAVAAFAAQPGDVASRARARVHPAMAWPAIAERHLELYEELRSRRS
jgi:glycosyltransferase involved in cell wall biosynthesis